MGMDGGLNWLNYASADNRRPLKSAMFHYFLANAWSLGNAARNGTDAKWDWEQLEYEKVLLHLRRAIVA